MSEQWVDRQGILRNSSGRYRRGEESPMSQESRQDEENYKNMQALQFLPAPATAWSTSCRPDLATVVQIEPLGIFTGISIRHAKSLLSQLGAAIRSYEAVNAFQAANPDAARKFLCDRAGITLGNPHERQDVVANAPVQVQGAGIPPDREPPEAPVASQGDA